MGMQKKRSLIKFDFRFILGLNKMCLVSFFFGSAALSRMFVSFIDMDMSHYIAPHFCKSSS